MSERKSTPEVRVGQEIYLKGGMSMSHGADDYIGGKAIVKKVEMKMSFGKMVLFVTVEAFPRRSFNWEILSKLQDSLKETFGDKWAEPDPDYRSRFNRF